MSKNSPRQNYNQLVEWLPTFNKNHKNGKLVESRLKYYKRKNAR